MQNIGSLIEAPPLYDNLTAFENVKVHATLLGLSEDRINSVLKTVDIDMLERKEQGSFRWG